jgi:type III pantothenate kinase
MDWLLLDVGNSRLKWALAAAQGGQPVAADALAIAPGMGAQLVQAWRAQPRYAVSAAFGCSVAAADAVLAIEDAVMQAWSVPVHWFAAQAAFAAGGLALANGYRRPEQLGADRWHALLAARAAHPGWPLVVVSAGTATTVDCVTADGHFVGGVIAPGVQLMFDSLARATAQLPQAAGEVVAFPDNTDDAIASGVLGSQIGLIERIVHSFARTHGAVQLVLAGGAAAQLQPHLHFDSAAVTATSTERNLVLRGVLTRARAMAQVVVG